MSASGPQSPVAGDRRGEVPGVEVGRGVGRVQGLLPSVRQRMVQLCLLRDRAEHLQGGGPQVEVTVLTAIMSWAWLGPVGVFCRTVSWDAAESALCRNVSLWWDVARANQNGCSVCCSRTRRHVMKLSQGHLVDAAPAGTLLARPRSACRRRSRMTPASTVWTHSLSMPYCRGREAATPSPSGTVPEMATAHVRLRRRKGYTAGVPARSALLTRRRRCGPRPPGSSSTR